MTIATVQAGSEASGGSAASGPRTLVHPRAQFLAAAPGQHHHVVQRHPPPLRMVHIPSAAAVQAIQAGAAGAAAAAAAGGQRLPTLPHNPISIRHALPQVCLCLLKANCKLYK